MAAPSSCWGLGCFELAVTAKGDTLNASRHLPSILAHMTKRKLFTAAFLLTTAAMSVVNYVQHQNLAATRSKLTPISDGVFITSQLHPDAIPYLKRKGIRTVVDIRPDGEDAGQPPSTDIERAAKA